MREFAAVVWFFVNTGFFIFSFLFARALRLNCPACGKRIHRADLREKKEGPTSSKLTCPYCGHSFAPQVKGGPGRPR